VDKILAKDDYTVTISLTRPLAPFLAYLSVFANGILSADHFKDAPPSKLENQPMGSGPYMLGEWKKGEHLVLTANPHYWKPGYPKTKEVKLAYIPNEYTLVIKLQSGEVDGIDTPPMARLDELHESGRFDTRVSRAMGVTAGRPQGSLQHPRPKLFLSDLSLPRPPAADRIDEREEFIKCRVLLRSGRDGLIERREAFTSNRTVGIGPDRR
jgi:ABC-type transport system substrate-binding protein